MTPRAPAKPAPRPASVEEFERGYEPAVASEDERTRLNGVIRRIISAETLTQCLDVYCRKFSPTSPPQRHDAQMRARVIGYVLFMQAARLIGPLNPLQPQLAALDIIQAPNDDIGQTQLAIWARRWRHLEEGERQSVRQQVVKTLSDAARARPRHLLPFLIERCRADKMSEFPTIEQLLDFDLGTDAQKSEFKAWFEACAKPWRLRIDLKSRPPLQQTLDAVDEGFKAFRKRLDEAIKTPLDFFRVLKYARDSKPGDAWGFDHEIYLEVAAKGLQMSLATWKIASAYASRAFHGDDDTFVFSGIRFGGRGRARRLLRQRLTPMRKGPGYIQEESKERRRLFIAGAYLSLDLVDEVELEEIASAIDLAWRKEPLETAARWIYAPSAREVFNDRFWINQQVENGFTILWIDYAPDGNRWAYIEAHSIPGAIYKGNGSAISGLNERAFYKALAKNAEALTVFLLAYLEVLGWAADIATAGISGGFRHILWEFAKERLKEKMLEKGMAKLGIDNPWLQTAVGFGANFVKFPKGKARALSGLDSPASPRAVPVRPNGAAAGLEARVATLANPPRGQARAAAQADQLPAAKTDRGSVGVDSKLPSYSPRLSERGAGRKLGGRGLQTSGTPRAVTPTLQQNKLSKVTGSLFAKPTTASSAAIPPPIPGKPSGRRGGAKFGLKRKGRAQKPTRLADEGGVPPKPPEPPLTDKQLKKALREARELHEIADSHVPLSSPKSAAISDQIGVPLFSGPARTGTPADFPQTVAPGRAVGKGSTDVDDAAIWVRKYEEYSGLKASRGGRDVKVEGDVAATHAEVKDRVLQLDKGVNSPTAVSQDMCGACRLWHQKAAQMQGRTFIVADGRFTRVFRPDGSVEIRRPSGKLRRIVSPGQPPVASQNNYFGIEW